MAASSQQHTDMKALTNHALDMGAKRSDEASMDFFRQFEYDGFQIVVYYRKNTNPERPFWIRLFNGDLVDGNHLHDVYAGDLSSAMDGVGYLIHCRNRFEPTDE